MESNESDWKEMLKSETIGNIGTIPIDTKNIILFSGQSMAGKTASCLNICDTVIKGGNRVLYFDIDTKSILERAEPNFFKKFYNQNTDGYNSLFHYRKNLDNWIEDIKKVKPKLVIIDSLYVPFFNKYPEQRNRAKMIRQFLTDFRKLIWLQNMGAVITVPVGRVVDEGVVKQVPLGGEGVKYMADIKVMIHFADKNNDAETIGYRFFVVDRNKRHAFELGEGGRLDER